MKVYPEPKTIKEAIVLLESGTIFQLPDKNKMGGHGYHDFFFKTTAYPFEHVREWQYKRILIRPLTVEWLEHLIAGLNGVVK